MSKPYPWARVAENGCRITLEAGGGDFIVTSTDPDGASLRWTGTFHGAEAAAQREYQLAEAPMPEGWSQPGIDLKGAANAHQWALAVGGFTVTIDGAERTFATDNLSRPLIEAKYARFQAPGAPAAVNWQFRDGFAAIGAADFCAAALAMADFFQATFDALGRVEAAIDAGEITTLDEIEAYDAWPANH